MEPELNINVLSKTQKVKKHFDATENYLKNNLVVALRARLIKNYIPEIKNKNILDIGCGNGELTLPYIKGNKITFLDLSEKMLEIVKSNTPIMYYKNAEFINIDLEKFKSVKKYDYIFLVGVLAHINSVENTFKKISQLLNKDGIIILQFTNSPNIFSAGIRFISGLKSLLGDRQHYKVNMNSRRQINKELIKNNFRCIKQVKHWPALPGFILIPEKIRKIIYYRILNSRLLTHLGGEIILFITATKEK